MKVALLAVEQGEWGLGRFIQKSNFRSRGLREFYSAYVRESDVLRLRRSAGSKLNDALVVDRVADDSIAVSTVGDFASERLRGFVLRSGESVFLRSAVSDVGTEWQITLKGVGCDAPKGVEFGVPNLEKIVDTEL